MAESIFWVEFRKKITENTDPQRRCYNGCNFSERTYWSDWDTLCSFSTKEAAEDSATLYQRNHNIDYPTPVREYRVMEVKE